MATVKLVTMCVLTMPGIGSWNGKWSGSDRLYCVRLRGHTLPDGQYYYRWDDGYEACVVICNVPSKQASSMLRKSVGFYGYEWMIDSILKFGEIRKPDC